MQLKPNKILFFYLPLVLFIVSPFVQIYENEEMARYLSANLLSPVFSQIANPIRWLILFLMGVISSQLLLKNINKVSVPVILFSVFYFIQLFYAIIDGHDIDRFFLMMMFSFIIPFYFSYSIQYYRSELLNSFLIVIVAFLFLSIYLNGHLIFKGQRFFGFMNNSNLFGFSALFWLIISLIKLRDNNKFLRLTKITIGGLIIVIILTGSRNALFGLLLILFFYYRDNLKQFFPFAIVFTILFFIIVNIANIDFVIERLFNIQSSFSDSGRDRIWRKAYIYIQQNPWFGNGLNANLVLVNATNIHNCYIRFVLNMGIFFTVISLFFYFMSLAKIYFNKKIPKLFISFLVAFTLMNFGEDYFVGLGSSVFIYILIIFGFVNYYIKFKQ